MYDHSVYALLYVHAYMCVHVVKWLSKRETSQYQYINHCTLRPSTKNTCYVCIITQFHKLI